MAIQSDETLVTKGDLKTLYADKILPYLGGNMMMQTNVNDYYDEGERIVGIWKDGKPIYRKYMAVTDAGTYLVDNNLEKLVDLKIYFHNSSDLKQQEVANPCYVNGNFGCMGYIVDYNKILIVTTGNNVKPDYIYVYYTKSTDTASSALTTPGCYDLNRPDLWPNGQEIFFGNGLYGMRKAGIAASNSLQSGITLVSNVSKTACCYNKGGMIDMSGTKGTNWYDINGGWDAKGVQKQFNPLITNTDQTFRFYCQDNQNYTTQNIQYNIWFTYTK